MNSLVSSNKSDDLIRRLALLSTTANNLLRTQEGSNYARALIDELAISGAFCSDDEHTAFDYETVLERNRNNAPAKKVVSSQPIEDLPSPSNWQPLPLGAVATEIRYGTSIKAFQSGDIPVLRMGNIQDQSLDLTSLKYVDRSSELEKLILRKGDLLFNRTNSPALVGKSAVFDHEMEFTFASYLIRVRLDEAVDANFLNIWLGSPYGRRWAESVRTDAIGQSNINGTSLANFWLAIPHISVQHETVERHRTFVEMLRSISNDVLQLENDRTSLLKCTLHNLAQTPSTEITRLPELVRDLEDVDTLQDALLTRAFNGRLNPEIPPGAPLAGNSDWRWSTLSAEGEIVGGGTPRSDRAGGFEKDHKHGVPWLTPADLSTNREMIVHKARRNISADGLAKSSAKIVPKGTVLFSSRAPIGYVAIAGCPVATNQGFKSFVPGPNINSEFAYWWLRSRAKEIDANAPKTTFSEVNGRFMKAYPIPVPPLDTQASIAGMLNRIAEVCESLRDIIKTRP